MRRQSDRVKKPIVENWLKSLTQPGFSSNSADQEVTSAPEIELRRSKENALREESMRLDNQAKEQDQNLKRKIFFWVELVVIFYLLFIIAIVAISLPLSDNVMIALLTTTTINIIGLPALIIHSLFPKLKNKDRRKN
jgi:hypothetical protein